jgi:hypothetical protein
MAGNTGIMIICLLSVWQIDSRRSAGWSLPAGLPKKEEDSGSSSVNDDFVMQNNQLMRVNPSKL